MEEAEVVAHRQRATLRVGDVFLKVGADPSHADPSHADVDVRAMALPPVPTSAVL